MRANRPSAAWLHEGTDEETAGEADMEISRMRDGGERDARDEPDVDPMVRRSNRPAGRTIMLCMHGEAGIS
jgi:hypothetical protein